MLKFTFQIMSYTLLAQAHSRYKDRGMVVKRMLRTVAQVHVNNYCFVVVKVTHTCRKGHKSALVVIAVKFIAFLKSSLTEIHV